MNYATLKLIHISAVTVSICGFSARGLGALRGAPWVRHRLTRLVVHLVDTVLLLSAIGMLSLLHFSPWALPWLRAKILGLGVYIALGTLALRPKRSTGTGKSAGVRLAFWIGALVTFSYIVSVAVTKNPAGALAWLGIYRPG